MDNLPPDVIRVLSFHGPVDFIVGKESDGTLARVPAAPFEDKVIALVRKGSPTERALLLSTRAEIHARAKDGSYALRMVGRAHAGRSLNRNADWAAIEPWLPEDTPSRHMLAVPFTPSRIEFVRDEGEERAHYHGPTPAGKARAGAVVEWGSACFPLSSRAALVVAFVAPWVYLGIQGPELPGRWLALAMSFLGGAAALAGTRLLCLGMAYHRWRNGGANAEDAGPLCAAWFAPGQARVVGLMLLALAFSLTGLIQMGWDGTLAALTLLANGAWLLGPGWVIHLSLRPE